MSLLIKLEVKSHGKVMDTVPAISVGPFAVFSDFGAGNVTHAATGYAVKKGCCCLIHAISLAERLVECGFDWNRDREAIKTDPQRAEVSRIIKASSCPSHGAEA